MPKAKISSCESAENLVVAGVFSYFEKIRLLHGRVKLVGGALDSSITKLFIVFFMINHIENKSDNLYFTFSLG